MFTLSLVDVFGPKMRFVPCSITPSQEVAELQDGVFCKRRVQLLFRLSRRSFLRQTIMKVEAPSPRRPPQAGPLHLVVIDVSSRGEGVLHQQLHQLGARLLAGQHLTLPGHVGEGLPDAGISCGGLGCREHVRVQRP